MRTDFHVRHVLAPEALKYTFTALAIALSSAASFLANEALAKLLQAARTGHAGRLPLPPAK